MRLKDSSRFPIEFENLACALRALGANSRVAPDESSMAALNRAAAQMGSDLATDPELLRFDEPNPAHHAIPTTSA